MDITVNDLSKTYTGGAAPVMAIKNCSFKIKSGEQIAVTGASGSGKSTLLHLIAGLERADSGSIKYDNTDITEMSQNKLDDFRLKNIGIVFQSFNLLPEFTAYENIILPLMLQSKKIDKTRIYRLTEYLDLDSRCEHLPSKLSGGQQQRVAIARALVNEPTVLLCDEPTGNLDKKSSKAVIDLLFNISNKLNVTLIVVTHDESIAKRFDRIITISDGVLGGDIQ